MADTADAAPAEYRRRLERTAIGALILNPSAIDAVRPWLIPRDFATPHYQAWYQLVCQMRDVGTPVDQMTLLAELRRAGGNRLDRFHLVELATIVEQVPIPAAAVAYCTAVLEESLRRDLHAAGTRLVQIAGSGDPAVMFANARQVHADVDAGRRRWIRAHTRSRETRVPSAIAPPAPSQRQGIAVRSVATSCHDFGPDL